MQLKPKKYKEITSKIAKDNDWNEELVNDAVYFFYKRVRKALSTLEDTSVLIPKLGTFKIRKAKLLKMGDDKENLLTKLNPHEFTKYDSYRKNKEDLEKINLVKEKFNTLDKNKNEFTKEKDSDS